jgi:hypothetical protein
MIKYKQQRKPRTLTLTKETLVRLSDNVLKNVAGAAQPVGSGISFCWPCPPTVI